MATIGSDVVRTWLEKPKHMLIGRRWVNAKSGETFVTRDPSSGREICRVPLGDSGDVDEAVREARMAGETGPWSRMLPSDRERLLWKLTELIEENAQELAFIESVDNGKPLRFSLSVDIPATANHFRYFSGWPSKICGQTIPVSSLDHFNYTVREPVGVVGIIIPWNYPLVMLAMKLAPALACGNTVVLKPSEWTSLSALRLGELITEAGFPDGVVNIVTGTGATVGASMAEHSGINKISFTGSTEVGRRIIHASEVSLKRVSLELGGKSPNIIFSDADVDKAIIGAAWGIFFNQGEDCTAGSRIFVERPVYDRVVEGIVAQSKSLRVGPGLNMDTDIGPLISRQHQERVQHYVDRAVEKGGTIAGKSPTTQRQETDQGFFFHPTVLTNIQNDMQVAQEEIFGPVVVCMPFDDETDVLRMANDSIYGLAAGIWTQDVSRAHNMARRLQAGTVWVNCYDVYDPGSPFGGFKKSGHGRESGEEAIRLYTEVKSIWIGL